MQKFIYMKLIMVLKIRGQNRKVKELENQYPKLENLLTLKNI